MWFTTSRLNHSRERRKKVQTLSEEEKLKVEKIVFLLDKFFVGDAFYHEILMITDGLPRSYSVKQCCDELNKMCQTEPLNTKFEGVTLNSVSNCVQSTHV